MEHQSKYNRNLIFLGNHDRLQYFHITHAESNVETVTEKVRVGFDDPNLILVQSNGYKIEDNEATRGTIIAIHL